MSENTHKIPSLIITAENNQATPDEKSKGYRLVSCETCASFGISENGEEVCTRKQILLGNTHLNKDEQSRAHQMRGEECSSYNRSGTPEVKKVNQYSVRALSITQQAFFPLLDPENRPYQNVADCSQCHFRVERRSSYMGFDDDLGFALQDSTSYCSKRGLLLSDDHGTLGSVAAKCHESHTLQQTPFRTIESLVDEAVMIPEFNKEYLRETLKKERAQLGLPEVAEDDITSSLPNELTSRLPFPPGWDPVEQESVFVVDDGAKALGIRAWYPVPDPEGTGNTVIIPIFDRARFSERERAKIPTIHDDERPQDYVDHQGLIYTILVSWMELDETPALVGPAGTGKTEVLRTIAWMMQLPFERISITGSTELDDLQGKMLFKDGETVFQYGRLSAAWAKPNVICLDEPNVGPPEVWQFIRPLTDNSKQLVVDANNGETLTRNDNCFPGLAMNPAWDAKNIGAEFISDADSSRLLHIETRLPEWEVEEAIIKKRCELDGFEIPSILLDVLHSVSDDLRAMSDSGEIPISWGIRSQIKAARLMKWFTVERAYLQAGISSLEPSIRETVMDLIKTRTGDLAMRYEREQREERARKEREEKRAQREKVRREMSKAAGREDDSEEGSSKSTEPPAPPTPIQSPPPPGVLTPGGKVNYRDIFPARPPKAAKPSEYRGLSTGF